MNDKGFTEHETNNDTPNDISITEKPLNPKLNRLPRVDINVLKSKLQEFENKEFRKNLIIFISFVLGLGSLGIYLSI